MDERFASRRATSSRKAAVRDPRRRPPALARAESAPAAGAELYEATGYYCRDEDVRSEGVYAPEGYYEGEAREEAGTNQYDYQGSEYGSSHNHTNYYDDKVSAQQQPSDHYYHHHHQQDQHEYYDQPSENQHGSTWSHHEQDAGLKAKSQYYEGQYDQRHEYEYEQKADPGHQGNYRSGEYGHTEDYYDQSTYNQDSYYQENTGEYYPNQSVDNQVDRHPQNHDGSTYYKYDDSTQQDYHPNYSERSYNKHDLQYEQHDYTQQQQQQQQYGHADFQQEGRQHHHQRRQIPHCSRDGMPRRAGPRHSRPLYSSQQAPPISQSSACPDIFSLTRHGRYEQVESLLDSGLPTDLRDPSGNTILIIAAQNGLKRIAKLALRRGADINCQNYRGNTPLHYCYAYNFGDTLGAYLLSKGANPLILNKQGLCPKEFGPLFTEYRDQ